jgi:hypothetical protein
MALIESLPHGRRISIAQKRFLWTLAAGRQKSIIRKIAWGGPGWSSYGRPRIGLSPPQRTAAKYRPGKNCSIFLPLTLPSPMQGRGVYGSYFLGEPKEVRRWMTGSWNRRLCSSNRTR